MTICQDFPKILIVFLIAIFMFPSGGLLAASGGGIVNPENDPNGKNQSAATPKELFEKALLSQKDKESDRQVTADLFYEVHKKFPEAPEAERALWQSAVLGEELAMAGKKDWEDVRDLYREYISYHPGGEYAAQAYLGVGVALYNMNFRREAITYLNLCIKRFSEEQVTTEAKMSLAKVLADVGRTDESLAIYKEIEAKEEGVVRLRAVLGQAEILNSKEEYGASLKIYHELAAQKENFFFDELEALRVFGKANVYSGNVEKGQGQLIHYLNLVEGPEKRSDVLFDIGESYWRQKKIQAARKMYLRAIEEGESGSKSVLFSQMRIMQDLDDPDRPPEKWAKPHELTDPEGDQPYLAVLDRYYNDPLAQVARQGLFWRFRARGDIDNMLDYGKNYLRFARTGGGASSRQEVGEIFLALADTLLEKKKYQDLYDIYHSEYEFIKDYPDGRLLYLVGQAMEALSLYDQAAVIYYRSLKWPLSEADKADLYFRRVHVYLAKGDLESAERLLEHLRKIYQGKMEAGEVYSYSGRLREAQKREGEALEFYRKAVAEMTFPEKKAEYAGDVVRMALRVDGGRASEEITGYLKSGYLSGPDLQEMYAAAGDVLRLEGENSRAAEMYSAALSEGLPKEGRTSQSVHLYLGDSLVALDRREEGAEHYRQAAQGEDPLLKQMARERLNQNDIEKALSNLKNDGGS